MKILSKTLVVKPLGMKKGAKTLFKRLGMKVQSLRDDFLKFIEERLIYIVK